MGLNKYSFKESYLSFYIQNAKDKPYAISGGISFVLAILATLNKIFNWIEDDVVNNILLIIPITAFAIVTLFCVPYLIWRSQQREIANLKSTIKRTNKLSDKERKDIAHIRDSQVLDIPSTLRSLHRLMLQIATKQIEKGLDKNTIIQVVLELLDIYEIDTTDIIDERGNLATVDEKRLKKKLGRILRKTMKVFTTMPSTKIELIKLLSYIEGALKSRNMSIGQYCMLDRQYQKLMAELSLQVARVTPNLSMAIDEALLVSHGHCNMMFLSLYTEFDSPTLRMLRTLKLRKFTSAIRMLDRPVTMIVDKFIAIVSKYADEYVVGINE